MKFTSVKSALELTSLLLEFGLENIVICPGSRNIPLIQSLVNCGKFKCLSVNDERSAAFIALGLANTFKPAAVCCTSGSALLNMHPAIAEAYYRKLPLLIISADRPKSNLNQLEGQTLPQDGVFGNLAAFSCTLPEVKDQDDLWYCNRLINEALLKLTGITPGPVHINVPISEPFFDFSVDKLPKARRIKALSCNDLCDLLRLGDGRNFLILGQNEDASTSNLSAAQVKALNDRFIILSEHPANFNHPGVITAFDELIKDGAFDFDRAVVITMGGHVISKWLKLLLRRSRCLHVDVRAESCIYDLSRQLAYKVDASSFAALQALSACPFKLSKDFQNLKLRLNAKALSPVGSRQGQAVGIIMDLLPQNSSLHLANSSTVRLAQRCSLPQGVKVYCNRGVSGIEGSLSTAIGCALLNKDERHFLLIGDMSFYYDLNALAALRLAPNLKIIVFGNTRGQIFHLLQGLELDPQIFDFVDGSYICGLTLGAERGFTGVKTVYHQAGSDLMPKAKAFMTSSTAQILFIDCNEE